SRNLRQLAFVIIGISLGTAIGAIAARPDVIPGALVGAFCGLVGGTLFGGILAGQAARSPAAISRAELQRCIVTLEKQCNWWRWINIVSVIFGLGSLPFLLHWSADWACPLTLLVLLG